MKNRSGFFGTLMHPAVFRLLRYGHNSGLPRCIGAGISPASVAKVIEWRHSAMSSFGKLPNTVHPKADYDHDYYSEFREKQLHVLSFLNVRSVWPLE